MIVGVDFGAPQRARDQRRKIIAIAAHSTGWHSYRIDATGMNTRLLANDPPAGPRRSSSTSSRPDRPASSGSTSRSASRTPRVPLQLGHHEDAGLRRGRRLRRALHGHPPCGKRLSPGARERPDVAGAAREGVGRRALGPDHHHEHTGVDGLMCWAW